MLKLRELIRLSNEQFGRILSLKVKLKDILKILGR